MFTAQIQPAVEENGLDDITEDVPVFQDRLLTHHQGPFVCLAAAAAISFPPVGMWLSQLDDSETPIVWLDVSRCRSASVCPCVSGSVSLNVAAKAVKTWSKDESSSVSGEADRLGKFIRLGCW